MFNNNFILKGFLFFIVTFVLFSCSSSDDTDETCCDAYPPETRKFISKINFESSDTVADVFKYNYNSNNNLISIEKNETTVTFFYEGTKISRVEIKNNSTGEIINYRDYFYNSDGLLDYYDGDFYLLRVERYEYENDRVVKIYNYNTIADLNNNSYTRLTEVLYDDDTYNVFEYRDYNFNGNLMKRSTYTYGADNKRYFGEAAKLIDLPYSSNILESFNYNSNYNIEGWKTQYNSDELYRYKESFYENDENGYCLNWDFIYYNIDGVITHTFTKSYEYVELEIN